jgi:hypothetical protein
VHHERIDRWHYGRPTFGVQILHALTRLGAKMSKHPKLPELLRRPAVLEGDNGRTARPPSLIEKPGGS